MIEKDVNVLTWSNLIILLLSLLQIYENGQFSHFIDGSDENISSWMRFIRCARHKTEQNMSVLQYGKNIYYYATRDIEVGDEMLVWYHESYYQFWGVPLMLAQQLDGKNGKQIHDSKVTFKTRAYHVSNLTYTPKKSQFVDVFALLVRDRLFKGQLLILG